MASNGTSNGVNSTSNGIPNGTANGSKPHTSPPPITHNLAAFISTLEFSSIPARLIIDLKTLLLDHLGVALYGAQHTSSSAPFLAAINALNSSGTSTVLTRGSSFQPQYAMLLNGAYAHSLDFDDTHLEGVVHPGATVITAALTVAETLQSSGKELLTAIAAGHEVVCRLGIAIGSSGYAKGFHNTSTCGIFGAIAAISKLRGLKAEVIENAFGIGISKTAGNMQFLVSGAWNKRLHPGFAAHDAFLAVTFAEAGVVGALNAIEGEHGLLRMFGTVSNYDSILEAIGENWVCKDTAIKVIEGFCLILQTIIW
ncbi:2-methylcitrate dehydratase PrpD [Hyaloscypha variabilis F]|uniref:2-methylcitrate dehydratase PrpD n=1 Tax=Hyaloscypha variabilis (strain UAMH 11265 / GT02V1 / F) TaxID=1149755 RepID=A0A2J6QTP6_HYAVF|nr:2-methylcitrate dehydratase PrpD [Hyaloscypha variabilis F]